MGDSINNRLMNYKMKKLTTCIASICLTLLCANPVLSQVLIDKSAIQIVPYFSKNDTMEYQYTHIVATINGTDTVYNTDTYETFQMICTKANDKKGYRLEQVFLDAGLEVDSTASDVALKVSLYEIMKNCFKGMRIPFTIDGLGQNLALENENKVRKEFQNRYATVWDSLNQVNPALTAIVNKEMLSALVNNMMNANFLQNNSEEVVKMFEFHGKSYEINKEVSSPIDPGELGSHVGVVKAVAMPAPEEGQEPKDWDDYRIIIDGVSYQDAALAAVYNVKQKTGKDLTVEDLKKLMGDKMPTGEIQVAEEYNNDYFYDGWPKDLWYRKTTTQNGSSIVEVKHLEWLTRSVNNNK